MCVVFFFCKQKTAYEMRISDWSSDVCSSDLAQGKIAVHIHDRCKEGNDMQPRNCTTIGRSVGQDQSALRRSLLIGTALALLWSGPALARNAPPGDDETIDESETTAATTEDEKGEIIIDTERGRAHEDHQTLLRNTSR